MLTSTDITSILRDLHIISGFRISLHDTERNEIAAYPKEASPFCEFVQKNPSVLSSCHENDANAFMTARESGEPYIYQCRFGLYEAVAPLYHFGVLSGFLMMGQVHDSLQNSRQNTFQLAKSFVPAADFDGLQKAINDIPVCSVQQMHSCIHIMSICAGYITLSNRLLSDEKDLPSRVKKYINRNFAAKITLELLCQRFFCSRTTLIQSFKKATGKSVNSYLTEVRLKRAEELLRTSEMSIFMIAEQCGFSDQNYFTKVFQKHFQTPPSRYRMDGNG